MAGLSLGERDSYCTTATVLNIPQLGATTRDDDEHLRLLRYGGGEVQTSR